MKETFDSLSLVCLDRSGHSRTCGYWFLVQNHCAAHTAFATRAGLMQWMMERGISAPRTIPLAGKFDTMPLIGSYRRESHLGFEEVSQFDTLRPLIETRTVDNGDYVEARITLDHDSLRTVHVLNCNVKRHVYDYAESRELIS